MKIFFITGEKSGDKIGASVAKEILRYKPDAKLYGFVGDCFNGIDIDVVKGQENIRLMGFSGIISKLPKILITLRNVRKKILDVKPDIIFSVDSYDFCSRALDKMRAFLPDTKFYHYKLPSVWSYRPNRIKKVAEIWDSVFCLMPFEVNICKEHGIKAQCVGQPIINTLLESVEPNLPKNPNLVLVTLGSRKSELKYHTPVIKKVISQIREKYGSKYEIICLATKDCIPDLDVPIVTDEDEKTELMKIAKYAICKSGTNALEMSALGVDIIVYYKLSLLTEIILRMVVKAKYISIVNLIADKKIIPELICKKANPENILKEFEKLIEGDQNTDNTVSNIIQSIHFRKSESAIAYQILS